MANFFIGAKLNAPSLGWEIPESVVLMTGTQIVTVDSTGGLHLYQYVNGILQDDANNYWKVQNV
jgi:hypothetical protein